MGQESFEQKRAEDLPGYLEQPGVLVLAGPAELPLGCTSTANPAWKRSGFFQYCRAGCELQRGSFRS